MTDLPTMRVHFSWLYFSVITEILTKKGALKGRTVGDVQIIVEVKNKIEPVDK